MKAESAYGAGTEQIHNFTKEENEALTRVGPGSLMGNLFRQYWIPVTPAADMREPGGRPLRVKLLGEDLVLFRDEERPVGTDRFILSASPGAAILRSRRRGWAALSLSWLDVCSGRQVPRDAEHSR